MDSEAAFVHRHGRIMVARGGAQWQGSPVKRIASRNCSPLQSSDKFAHCAPLDDKVGVTVAGVGLPCVLAAVDSVLEHSIIEALGAGGR